MPPSLRLCGLLGEAPLLGCRALRATTIQAVARGCRGTRGLWGKRSTTRAPSTPRHAVSRCCRLIWDDWVCSAPSVPLRRLTGPHSCPASRALLLSQAGQFASRALNVLPTRDDVAIPSAQFRVLLLRRLRLPLPLAPRRCSCHGVLDRSATTAPPVRRRACSPPVRCPWSMPSPPSQGAARPTRAPTSSRAPRSPPPRAASAPRHTPSWTERAVVGWSSSASKLAAGLVPKRCNSCPSLLAIGQRRYRPTCGPPQSPWHDIHNGLRPAQCDLPDPGERCQGWQHHGARSCSTHFRETELLPALQPPAQAMLRSRRPDHTPPAWLSAVPGEAGSALPPDRMLIALRRRHGCPCLSHRTDVARTATDAALTLTPTVTTMPRAPELGCSPDELSPSSTHGCVSHARLLDPGVDPADRRRLDFVAYGPLRGHAAGRSTVLRRDTRVPADARREAPALCCLA